MSKKAASTEHYKVGIVTEVHGENLYATNPQGEVRQLTVGSSVYSDDKIESREGSSMVVQASNGQTINIPDDIYDQMLSSAITKELSIALEGSKENQAENSKDPQSNNQPDSDQKNQHPDHSLNNSIIPEANALQLDDVLCSEDTQSLNYWLDDQGATIGSFSFVEMVTLSTENIDLNFQIFEDFSV